VWYVFYFVITIFFCSFYLLNLVLAVVYLSYEKELHSLEQEVSEINSMSTRIVRHGGDITTEFEQNASRKFHLDYNQLTDNDTFFSLSYWY